MINNDTYTEVPKVFNRVAPFTYAKNKKGYTIVAEARASPLINSGNSSNSNTAAGINTAAIGGGGNSSATATAPVASANEQAANAPGGSGGAASNLGGVGPGRWRLRLIGAHSGLLAPRAAKSEIVSLFDVREARDFYIPNEHRTIMRYKVTVTGADDHLTSLQITTSKPDVYVKLAIYDNGVEMLSATGKGCAVIPAFVFIKDRTLEVTSGGSSSSRPGSKNRKCLFY